ncbi:MAG: GSCFA domain-containing protein [Bacteroidales bacterium]|nr:GSCFA domain-containing protein [Bacteroidales bacterium]
MNLRTTFNIDPSPRKITYNDRVMFIGSCFASSIGEQMEAGKMGVMINPAGTVYNPVSVGITLDNIISGKEFTRDDLHFHDGLWLSFSHYTDFSSEDPEKALLKINSRLRESSLFLESPGFLFITFGTARIYRNRKSGLIVSNCHKIPAGQFSSELLTVNEIVELWNKQLDTLSRLYPHLKVIFTISPVRHMKDGAHGNLVSKSVLLLAVEELLKHSSLPQYFPAYELVMDDLRDYRFYDDDMIHPSASAINYIWEAFTGSYFEDETINIWNEAVRITRARNHHFNTDSITRQRDFAQNMLSRISQIEKKYPAIIFSEEKTYFLSLLDD